MTTTARSELLPDLPTIGDFVPGYEASGSFGFGAPRNTPAEIVEKLNREINADPCYGAKDSLFFWIGNLLGKALNCLVDWNQKSRGRAGICKIPC